MLNPFHDQQSQDNFTRLEQLLRTKDATAIVGAGASMSVGMPDWRGLYSLLCKEVFGDDAQECSQYNPTTVTRRLEELRNHLGDQRTLQLIKSSFDRPIVVVPEIYQIVGEAFRKVVTTNYDNLLMNLAMRSEVDPRIEIYPKVRAEARYFYLHGHAATADTIHDIVLCEDEYGYAYDHENGVARSTLWRLLQEDGPCVFIGTSLDDPDFLHTIKQTGLFRRRQIQRRAGGTETYDLDPDWFLFKSVPRPTEISQILPYIPSLEARKAVEDQWTAELITKETEQLLFEGIKPIWYVRDPGHTRLHALLRRLAEVRRASYKGIYEPVFLAQAEELEALGTVVLPDPVQQERVMELISNLPEARRHFFQYATSPAWFEILYDHGMITLVPEPRQEPDGQISIDLWDAAPYVTKLLTHHPESVAKVISDVRTLNWHALRVLATALSELPTRLLLPFIPTKILEWLETPYSSLGVIVPNAISICNRLIDDMEYEKASQLVEALLQPSRHESAGNESTISGDEAPEVIVVAKRLSSLAPKLSLPVFERLINAAMPPEFGAHEAFYWSMWRPAIEDSEVTLRPYSSANLFVSGLRDAAISLVEHQLDVALEFLSQSLISDSVILRRIGLYVVSVNSELISDLEEVIFRDGALFDTASFHEMSTILNLHFASFSMAERTRILELVKTGPPIASGETGEEDRKSFWQWRLLFLIPFDQLSDELQALRKSLQDRWGQPESLTYLAIPEATFAKPPATLEQVRELLVDQGPSGLLRVMRNPGDHFAVEWDTDVSLGWQQIKTLVIESPTELLSLAPLVTSEDLEIDGIWWFLDAYTELARAGNAFDWEPLLNLADTTIAKLDSQPSWKDANWLGMLARLLEVGVVSANRIPDDHLPRVVGVLRELVERFARPVAVALGDDDLHIHQLNSVAGRSADGLLQTSWRCLEETAPPMVRETLREKLLTHLSNATMGAWGGQEALFAIGRDLPVLERLSIGWAEDAVRNIYTIGKGPNRSGAIKSFWSGCLSAPQVYNNVMQILRERYSDLLQSLDGETDYALEEELQNRLAEHIVIGWLRGLEGFGVEGLAGDLARFESDSVLAHTAWYLGKQLEAVKSIRPDSFQEIWKSVLAYWRVRVEVVESSLSNEPDSIRKEADRITTWLTITDVEPSEIENELEFTVRLVTIGFALEQVAGYLLRHVAAHTSLAARLASMIADRWIRQPEVVLFPKAFTSLLESIHRSGSPADRRVVEQIVDRLLKEDKADLRMVLGAS